MEVRQGYPCHAKNHQRGRAGPVSFLVIHYVGALGGAEANAKYYGSTPGIGASAHYFVGHASEGAAVYQSVDEGDTAWHCGRSDGKYVHPSCRNANSIGIEMCCHQDRAGRWYFDPETVDRTVELAREIMARHGIPVGNVVRHCDVTGKNCPAPFVEDPVAWAAFQARLEESDLTRDEVTKLVRDEIVRALSDADEAVATAQNRPVSPWAAAQWEKARVAGIFDGTKPNGPMTREQDAVVFDRLGLLERKGT